MSNEAQDYLNRLSSPTPYAIRNTLFQIRYTLHILYPVICCLSSVFCFLFSVLAPLHLSRILYKSPLFMQNKPNFQKSQMNVTPYNTTDYENKSNWTLGESKPNSNPISAESLLNLSINFADNTSCSLVTPCLISDTGYSYLGRQKMEDNLFLSAAKNLKLGTGQNPVLRPDASLRSA